MFSGSSYENSRSDGIGVLEIVSGVRTKEDQRHRFVPLKRTDLTGQVVGPLAQLHLTQVYGFTREQCNKVIEAAYRFPLPGDAAVTGVVVRFGTVEIIAELKEREAAELDYEEAKREGKQAALVTRESPDVFTLQVAGIEPDQEVTVQTSYVQLARVEGPGWSLRVPLTTSPRYVRSDEITSRHAGGQPLLLLRDPGHRFSLDLSLRGAGAVQSSTHRLSVQREGDSVRAQLQDGEVIPDRDFVVNWQPEQDQARPTLQVMLHDDPGSGQVYFLALVAPPAASDPQGGVPREIVLLVDHSGSMEGAKWKASDWAVNQFLSGLTEPDVFDIGLFHNRTRWFSRALRAADADTVREAIRFVETHRDSGGTELGVALEQALNLQRTGGIRSRHVLVVTDAEVTDAGRIFRLASEESERSDRRRISVLCIDAAPNSFLALELAERGGGMARFLTSDPEEEDISTALDRVLEDWAQPVLAGMQLDVSRAVVRASGHDVVKGRAPGTASIDLGDLPAGRSVWVTGRVARDEPEALSFALAAAGRPEVAVGHPRMEQESANMPALKALFGARRILGLEYLIHSGHTGDDLRDQLERLGYDPDTVSLPKTKKVYAENVRKDVEAALKGLLTREALAYGLACSETAFVAVRKEAGKPVEGRVAVASGLPAGWSDRFASPMMLSGGAYLSAATLSAGGGALRSPMAPADLAGPAFMRKTLEAAPRPVDRVETLLFSGVPGFTDGEAVLYDSDDAAESEKLPDRVIMNALSVRFPDGTPKRIDPGLSLQIFVGDLASPRARVRVADVIRQGGERPINISKSPGQVVRITLLDPAGAWATGAPRLEIALR